MKAMLLAAGLGTRLKPFTNILPKPLIPVANLPLIFYNLALLKKYGITDVVINLHHLGSHIRSVLKNGKDWGFKFTYSNEPTILGTGGGIFAARKQFGKDPFLVINADIILDINIDKLVTFHKKNAALATLALIPQKSSEHSTITINRQGLITSMLGKGSSVSGKKTTFTGVHIIDPKIFRLPHPKGKFCIVRDTYMPILISGGQLGGYLYKGYWNDLGTIDRWVETSQLITQKKIKLSTNRILKRFNQLAVEKNLIS